MRGIACAKARRVGTRRTIDLSANAQRGGYDACSNLGHGFLLLAACGRRSAPEKVGTMNSLKMAGLVLFVVGALGLAYGGFSYTKDTTAAKLGSLELKVQER